MTRANAERKRKEYIKAHREEYKKKNYKIYALSPLSPLYHGQKTGNNG